jgi:hypothetical protein
MVLVVSRNPNEGWVAVEHRDPRSMQTVHRAESKDRTVVVVVRKHARTEANVQGKGQHRSEKPRTCVGHECHSRKEYVRPQHRSVVCDNARLHTARIAPQVAVRPFAFPSRCSRRLESSSERKSRPRSSRRFTRNSGPVVGTSRFGPPPWQRLDAMVNRAPPRHRGRLRRRSHSSRGSPRKRGRNRLAVQNLGPKPLGFSPRRGPIDLLLNHDQLRRPSSRRLGECATLGAATPGALPDSESALWNARGSKDARDCCAAWTRVAPVCSELGSARTLGPSAKRQGIRPVT